MFESVRERPRRRSLHEVRPVPASPKEYHLIHHGANKPLIRPQLILIVVLVLSTLGYLGLVQYAASYERSRPLGSDLGVTFPWMKFREVSLLKWISFPELRVLGDDPVQHGQQLPTVQQQHALAMEVVIVMSHALPPGRLNQVVRSMLNAKVDMGVKVVLMQSRYMEDARALAFALASGEYLSVMYPGLTRSAAHLACLRDYLRRHHVGELLCGSFSYPLDNSSTSVQHDTSRGLGPNLLVRSSVLALAQAPVRLQQHGVSLESLWSNLTPDITVLSLPSGACGASPLFHGPRWQLEPAATTSIITPASVPALDTATDGVPRVWVDAVVAPSLSSHFRFARHLTSMQLTSEKDIVRAYAFIKRLGPKEQVVLIVAAEHVHLLSRITPSKRVTSSQLTVVAWYLEDSPLPYTHAAELMDWVDICAVAVCSVAMTHRVHLFHPVVTATGKEHPQRLLDAVMMAAASPPLPPQQPAAAFRPYVPQARMRVVLQVSGLDLLGGLELFVLAQAQHLQRMGYVVHVCNLGRAGAAAERFRNDSVPIIQAPWVVDASQGLDREQAQWYSRTIRTRASVLIAHHSPLGAAQCRAVGIPFLQTMHGTYAMQPEAVLAQYQQSDRYVTAYLGISALSTGYAELGVGLDVSKVVQVGIGAGDDGHVMSPGACQLHRAALRKRLLGIDEKKSGGGDDDAIRIFLLSGAVYEDKGTLFALHAFNTLRTMPEHQDRLMMMAIVGACWDEDYCTLLRSFIHASGLDELVVLHPHTDHIGEWYCAADIYVQPSCTEGWSTSLGEAALARLPIVASRVGGAAEQLRLVPHHQLVDILNGHLPWELTRLQYWETVVNQPTSSESPFMAALCSAMQAVLDAPRATPSSTIPLTRREVLYRHALVMEWVLAGGTPAALRNTLHARWNAAMDTPWHQSQDKGS